MKCNCGMTGIFEDALNYASPAAGGWGVLKTAQLIPESYHLFISPAACGRHGAMAAIMEGRKEKVSYLHLTEHSVVSGDYEQLIMDGVDAILKHLEKKNKLPRVFTIFVSCIDDLLGTDRESVLDDLHEKYKEIYPKIKFIFCHMNPTSIETHLPPSVNVQNKIYSVLDPAKEHDKGVNFIGNLDDIIPDGEVLTLLREMGASAVRHVSHYDSYDEYQEMAKSSLNLVVAPAGKFAAQNMESKLGIPYEFVLTSFRAENIRNTYKQIANAMNVECPNLDKYEKEMLDYCRETVEYLNGMPLIVDGSATGRPFELTRALLELGFTVEFVCAQKLIPYDKDDFEWLLENHPEIPIVQPRNAKITVAEKVTKECIAIGFSSGYLSGAEHVVNIVGQNGLYGYYGMITLMKMIREASKVKADLKKTLEDLVLVI